MEAKPFVEQLHNTLMEALRRLDEIRGEEGPATGAEVIRRLKLALRQELEAAEIAAVWLPSSEAVEVKLSLARLCGDEGRHYRLIARRLGELGEDVSDYNPLAQGRSKLYDFFAGLADPVERIAAAQFTREAIGHLRNEQFIAFCQQAGDAETARLYREEIQPDEAFHAQNGRALLEKYAVGAEVQGRARAAAERTLAMAEGVLQTMAAQHMGRAPGC
ncbi:MAG TPA: ferritin-like domain-containing protein [Candidatus Xenobia bacterium]|jgi:1,2-phenylacetyl-CoA epoxidase catalytic subunit